MFEEISARNLLGETGLVDEVIVHTVKLAGPRCARRERHRDCRGDAVPGDCRNQCAREAGLAAAARCRNDEETALTHSRCPSPLRFLRLPDAVCLSQDILDATTTLPYFHTSSSPGSPHEF